jgi:hypothetical protein
MESGCRSMSLSRFCASMRPIRSKTAPRFDSGQKKLVSLWDRVMPGPDTDQVGTAHR